jgi:pimeloyl-ACP methyl ester carboxylesterase
MLRSSVDRCRAARTTRWLCPLVALAVVGPATTGPAHASSAGRTGGSLAWSACRGGFQCATLRVPRDYARPGGARLRLAVIRLPARGPGRRIGSLVVNFGGPGEPGLTDLRGRASDFTSLNDRFDIVSFDPRGVGASRPSIDCRIDQETAGTLAQPFTRPATAGPRRLVARDRRYFRRCLSRNRKILPYVSTANVARDLDRLRATLGDARLSYLGFSYGTVLGATYGRLFGRKVRALVLDGPLDAEAYFNRPLASTRAQTAGFEDALGRFLAACAAHTGGCPFGGRSPRGALDRLLARLDRRPLTGGTGRRAVDGDDARAAVIQLLYQKQLWPVLLSALIGAQRGDGSLIRQLADVFYGREGPGRYDPVTDRFFTISALEQRYPTTVDTFLRAGRRAFRAFPHFWWNAGYTELAWGLYPVRPRGVYRGPFRLAASMPTPLVVATTHDPATPYGGARRLVGELRNARLLTMRGDGHTAYGGNSPCVDAAVEAYLERLRLPPRGASCAQRVPFAVPARAAGSVAPRRALPAPGLGPVAGPEPQPSP